MFVFELFDIPHLNVEERLRNAIENVLIPLVAQGVPYTTVDAVIQNLSDSGERSMGLRIDRALVMQLLNPDETGIVKKIEGDRVFLTMPATAPVAKGEQDEERDVQHVMNNATDQAKKQVQEKP